MSPTVREVVDRIVALDLVDPHVPAEELSPEAFDEDLDYFGEPDYVAVLRLLEQLRIAYFTDYKTFRGACEGGGEGYQEELERFAATSRGYVTITDIELVDTEPGKHRLSCRFNDSIKKWSFRHGGDEDMEAHLSIALDLPCLWQWDPGWYTPEPAAPDLGTQVVFGDQEALNQLGKPFGLAFD
jgi:hypothetical protein